MNAKISVIVSCVEMIIYSLLYNLHDCTCKSEYPRNATAEFSNRLNVIKCLFLWNNYCYYFFKLIYNCWCTTTVTTAGLSHLGEVIFIQRSNRIFFILFQKVCCVSWKRLVWSLFTYMVSESKSVHNYKKKRGVLGAHFRDCLLLLF